MRRAAHHGVKLAFMIERSPRFLTSSVLACGSITAVSHRYRVFTECV